MIYIYADTIDAALRFKNTYPEILNKPTKVFTNARNVVGEIYERGSRIFFLEGASSELREDIRQNGNKVPYPVQVVDVRIA